MASRIFWILVGGLALVGGMIMQDGRGIFSWGDSADHSRSIEQRIEARVDRAIDRSVRKMQVIDSRGEEIDVPVETKRELTNAVGRLVKAETELAMLEIRDGSKEEIDAATVRRDRANADVETLKAKIEGQKGLAGENRHALRDEIRTDVREAVRDAVRD